MAVNLLAIISTLVVVGIKSSDAQGSTVGVDSTNTTIVPTGSSVVSSSNKNFSSSILPTASAGIQPDNKVPSSVILIAGSSEVSRSVSFASVNPSSSIEVVQKKTREVLNSFSSSVNFSSSSISRQQVSSSVYKVNPTTEKARNVTTTAMPTVSPTEVYPTTGKARNVTTTAMPTVSPTEANTCFHNPCKNNGTCKVDSNGTECICPIGYETPKCADKRECFWRTMYPFGPRQKDTEMATNSYWRCQKINAPDIGIPFFTQRHYKLFICRNGLIQFDLEWPFWYPYKFGARYWFERVAMLAPYWALTDMYWAFKREDAYRYYCSYNKGCTRKKYRVDPNQWSSVYYHVYDKYNNELETEEMLSKASKDVRKYHAKAGFTNFQATWVLVATWVKLYPEDWYYYYYRRESFYSEKSNTFQSVLITNGTNTFLMYNYPCDGIQWSLPVQNYYWSYASGKPVAGYNSGTGPGLASRDNVFFNLPRSGDISIATVDENEGNTQEVGRWFFRIEDHQGSASAREKCIAWQQWHSQSFRELDQVFSSLDPCPCQVWQAWWDGNFWLNSLFCASSRNHLAIKFHNMTVKVFQQCCYSTEWNSFGALLVGLPNGGHATVQFPDQFHNSKKELGMYTDSEAYDYCCVQSTECERFYKIRPSRSCDGYRPPPRRWGNGDPHFITLDNQNYTFNGLGEYVMLDAKDGFFQLQARTQLASEDVKATVFSAGAAQETNSSKLEVRVKNGGGLEILINGTSYQGYSSLTNQSVEAGVGLRISKPKESCFEASFPSGASVGFCEQKGMLSIVMTPTNSFKNTTKGLLGTWNDNPDDDFTLPDDSVLSSHANDSTIHYNFGLKWQITQQQSLFTYENGESVDTFRNDSYVPMFLDNIKWANDSLREQAEATCKGDSSCLFDAAATKDVSIGAATLELNVQLVKETKELENFPPEIVNATSVIRATVNSTVTMNITALDRNNDTMTFSVLNKPESATTSSKGNVFTFKWIVQSSERTNFTFVITDEQGASTAFSPTINMCACSNGSQCVAPEIGDPENTGSKFVLMGCACAAGYTGRLCESDIDACELSGQPCYPGVKCNDLPAPANISGYTCGPCPAGYAGNDAKCSDIDECFNKTTNKCAQTCVNTPGSFVCVCGKGYELNDNKHDCNDINECNLHQDDCMHTCTNKQGGYTCGCREYFKLKKDNKTCEPSNPCSGSSGCEQICFMVNGQKKCDCRKGYKLDSDEKSCSDVNECEVGNDGCEQNCVNTEGSYNCSCQKGFKLEDDGFKCEDINECMDWNSFNCTSDKYEVCVNTRGSYKCQCEEGLYKINGSCRGLKKNEKPPKPTLGEPRNPSNEEKQQSVQIIIQDMKKTEWNYTKDHEFKTELAKGTAKFCANNKTACGLKQAGRKRRAVDDFFTADQVHLLPGYPEESDSTLLVHFYVQMPLGFDLKVLPAKTLVLIVEFSKDDLERIFGKKITEVSTVFKHEESTTGPTPANAKSDTWKWIVIGVVLGVAVVVVVVITVLCYCKRASRRTMKVATEETGRDENLEMPEVQHT